MPVSDMRLCTLGHISSLAILCCCGSTLLESARNPDSFVIAVVIGGCSFLVPLKLRIDAALQEALEDIVKSLTTPI